MQSIPASDHFSPISTSATRRPCSVPQPPPCAVSTSRPGKSSTQATRFGAQPGRHMTRKAAQVNFHFCHRHLAHTPPPVPGAALLAGVLGPIPAWAATPTTPRGSPVPSPVGSQGSSQHPLFSRPCPVSTQAALLGASSQLGISQSSPQRGECHMESQGVGCVPVPYL